METINKERLLIFTQELQKYRSGKSRTEQRILDSENWWKLRSERPKTKGFQSVSGWLHNVIVSKHADAMEAYPEPNILPREPDDRAEAGRLGSIIPCVLEQNHFEEVYSDVAWQKLKTGTGVYKIIWDAGRLGGLGDICVERANLLNLYWEPGVTDIQKSRYFFQTELVARETLLERYPFLEGVPASGFVSARFLYDDPVTDSDMVTVIEVYYHRGGRLHYCKYAGDQVLYATENDPSLAHRGLYDHGLYPFVFDALFPIEGSPCGYGFVDLCRNPQTELDLLKTAFVENALQGAAPRYFSRRDGNINEDEFLDTGTRIVHVAGNVDEASIRRIDHANLDGMYVNVYDRIIQELRETSGNTETATGTVSSGVTAASAIAALQEASGKGSRDATRSAYRAYTRVVELCIELIRQFYEVPRQFRILGRYGQEQFVSYSNLGLKTVSQGSFMGTDLGHRRPVFDIRVSAQKKSVYTKVSQNELALQFFQFGFFDPALAQQAIQCLELMDFDGKEAVLQRVAQGQTDRRQLETYRDLALSLASRYRPDLLPSLQPQTPAAAPGQVELTLPESEENPRVRQARQQAQEAPAVN